MSYTALIYDSRKNRTDKLVLDKDWSGKGYTREGALSMAEKIAEDCQQVIGVFRWPVQGRES